jgi:hypothetical protein
MGIVAVFSIWVEARVAFWSLDFNLVDLINDSDEAILLAGCWLFLIGMMLCFVTPLGGVLELIGVTLFLMWFVPESDGDLPSNIGPYLGVVAGLIALASIARPLGPGLMTDYIPLRSRLLVFSGS